MAARHPLLKPQIEVFEAGFVDKWSSGDCPHNGLFEPVSYVGNYRLTLGHDVISISGWQCHRIRPLANQSGSLWRAMKNGNVRPMIIRPAPPRILYITLQARLKHGYVWIQGSMLSGRVIWRGRVGSTTDIKMTSVATRVRTLLLQQNMMNSTSTIVFMGHSGKIPKTAKLWSPHVKKVQFEKLLPKRRLFGKTDPRFLALQKHLAQF